MFVGANSGVKKRTGSRPSSTEITTNDQNNQASLFLLEDWKKTCSTPEGCQLIINSHLGFLTTSLQDQEPALRQLALEIISLVTVDIDNRPIVSAQPNLMDAIEKLIIGSLSQKKIADEVYARLLDAFLGDQNSLHLDASRKNEINIKEKKPLTTANRASKIVARPDRLTGESSSPSKMSKKPQTSHTINLFVENMNEAILTEVEACLLKTKGVISFFSDVDDGKVIVRLTSENLTDEVIASIYETTKHRTSIIKGDYDSSGFPLYITESLQKQNEGGFFSSFYQLVSVDQSKEKRGWLGGWW